MPTRTNAYLKNVWTTLLFALVACSSCTPSNVLPENAKSLCNSAYSKYQVGDYDSAIADCDKAIKLDSKYADPFVIRGMAKHNLKDYDGAIADYTRAIELKPKSKFAYDNRANAKASLKDYDGAIADFNKAIEIDSTNKDFYNNRGLAKYSKRDYAGAVLDFNKAIELSSTDTAYYNSRGNARDALEDYIGALADFNNVIELSPNSAFAYNNRGYDKLCLRDYVGAIADFSKSTELDPLLIEARLGNGEANRALGHYNAAMADFNKAIELHPQCAVAYRELGLTQDDVMSLRPSLANLQKSLTLDAAQLDVEDRIYAIRMQLGDEDNVTNELFNDMMSPAYRRSKAELLAIGGTVPTRFEIEPFLAGMLSESDFVKHADASIWGSKMRRLQLCEAYYYAAVKRLITGDRDSAIRLFQKCVDLEQPTYGDEGYDEYISATAELNVLKGR